MEIKNYVVKIGNDYVSEINPSIGLITTREQKEKLKFNGLKVAESYVALIKTLYNSYDTINIVSYEEDLNSFFYKGMTFEEVIQKAKPGSLERAKEIVEGDFAISIKKCWNSEQNIVYSCCVVSQTNRSKYYCVEITVDKNKKLVSTHCNCPDYEHRNNVLCKHILACIIYIINF